MGAFCLFCGYGFLEGLTKTSLDWLKGEGIPEERIRRLLEEHHPFGKAHESDVLFTLCLTCHREITEGLAREGVSMRPSKNLHKVIAGVLRSSAVLFEFLASSYRKWATRLEELDES
jgi:hypothetical protein